MMRLVNSTDSMYLTPPQQRELMDYAKSLRRRFDAARKVQQTESKILDDALASVQSAHPEIGDWSDAGWESHGKDLGFALRSVVRGMLVDDLEYAGATAVNSLVRELRMLEFPPNAVRGLFDGLKTACDTHLPPDSSELLAPYFAKVSSDVDMEFKTTTAA
ncbi:MAG: hypothetical protein U0798_12755 [Gemmataceae bacterium]